MGRRPLSRTADTPVPLPALAEAASAQGVAWALAGDGDLNANLVAFDAGGGVGEHVNAELDVLIVGVRGRGEVLVDGRALPLGPGDLLLVPRGARRGTRATTERFAYLTVHRRRQGLHLGPPRASGATARR